jgi:hypothetical protein
MNSRYIRLPPPLLECPVQNLLAKWGQLFRRFAPPNLGQRHFPLYEASLLSRRTVELPSICLLVLAVLFSGGKFDVSFYQALPARRDECRSEASIVNVRTNATSKFFKG